MSGDYNVLRVTGVNGCYGFYALGENKTTGVTKLYHVEVQAPEKGTAFPQAPIKGIVSETQTNNGCNGEVTDTTRGNQTTNEITFDLTYADDFNYIQELKGNFLDKKVTDSIVSSGTFLDGSDFVKVVGTNGTRAVSPFQDDLDFKWFFDRLGRLIDPTTDDGTGQPILKINNIVTGVNNRPCFAVEYLYAKSTNSKEGGIYPFCLVSGIPTLNEGASAAYNTKTASVMAYSERKVVDSKIIDALTDPDTMSTSATDALYKLDVDYLIEVSGGGTPTVAGSAGDTAVVIDSDDGTVTLFLRDSTDWINTPVTSNVAAGCVVRATTYATALDGTGGAAEITFASIKTASTSNGNGVAVDWFTDTSGSGATTYLLAVREWNTTNKDWENYAG